jgi:raffinose/stachyose/melibiose transport system substrate-binding protein
MQKRLSRRQILKGTALAGASLLMAACAPKVAPTTEAAATTAPEAPKAPEPTQAPAVAVEKKKFKLLVNFGDNAMPSDPSVQLGAGQKARIGLQPAVDDYMAANPNVTIEWYRMPQGVNGFEWMTARIAAKDCPDIYNFGADNIWPNLNKGWALDMTPYFDMSNPYMEGKQGWRSYLTDVGLKSQIGPDGKIYGYCLNGGGPIMCYNVDAFEKAGVTGEIKTWNDFIAACEKLKASGIAALSEKLPHCCWYHWGYGHIVNQLLYNKILAYDDSGDGFVTSKELVQHTLKGDWPIWDAELQFAKLMKQLVPYMPEGYLGDLDTKQLFRQGKAATYMAGAWFERELVNDPPPFKHAWMQYPIITKENWPDAEGKRVRLDGPWGSITSHLPGYLKDTEPDKIPVIVDFLMFIMQPKYLAAVCDEAGEVPFVKGIKTADWMSPWMQPYDRAVVLQSWFMLAEGAGYTAIDLLGNYFSGKTDDNGYVTAAKAAWETEVKKQLELNPDWKN